MRMNILNLVEKDEKKITVSIKDLHKSYGEKKVLLGVNLDVYEGEFLISL